MMFGCDVGYDVAWKPKAIVIKRYVKLNRGDMGGDVKERRHKDFVENCELTQFRGEITILVTIPCNEMGITYAAIPKCALTPLPTDLQHHRTCTKAR